MKNFMNLDSTAWDTGQKLLDEACDWFDEQELKKKLQELVAENPYFDGFG